VEALSDREGKHGKTVTEKEEMLSRVSFSLNDGDQFNEVPPAGHAHE
jgi:hypothetical protein